MAKTEKPKPRVLVRQKVLAQIMTDNVRKKQGKTLVVMMEEAGYSSHYARNAKLKRTASWQHLMEKYFPDKLMARQVKTLLEAKRIEAEEITVEEDGNKKTTKRKLRKTELPDYGAIKSGVELAARMKGRFQDKVGLDIESTKIDEALARLRKIIPPMEIQEGEIIE